MDTAWTRQSTGWAERAIGRERRAERKEGGVTTAGEVEGTPWLRLLLLLLRVWAVAEADAETQWRSQRAQKGLALSRKNGGRRWCKVLLLYHHG